MQVIALYNIKGGVGKTSTAVNLAAASADSGMSTLLWDLDAQGNATWLLGGQRDRRGKPKQLLTGKMPAGRLIQPTNIEHLDLLGSHFSARHTDVVMERLGRRNRHWLTEMLSSFSESYRVIILDCPPSLSRLIEQVFTNVDIALVPVVPAPLSLHSFEQVQQFWKKKSLPGKRLKPFFSMVDRNRRQHREWLYRPPEPLRSRLLPFIPYHADIEAMGMQRAPVSRFAPDSPAASGYRRLWRAVWQQLED